MSKPQVFITGAGGEVGHGLIQHLSREGKYDVVALDIRPLDPELHIKCEKFYQGDLLDADLLNKIDQAHSFSKIFHLAGLLSSGAERDPLRAHELNVEGSVLMLELARKQSIKRKQPTTFLFTSSIAAYGMSSLAEKQAAGVVSEDQYLEPITMYGLNKLYIEKIGRYYSENYNLLAEDASLGKIDFRCLRFPGIVSTDTLPSSGTSDYFPEMLHAAAQGKSYSCFVRPDTRIPHCVMPDAIKALIQLSDAPAEKLTRRVYNIGAFTISAEEIREQILRVFPNADISYSGGTLRQRIVDSWPEDINDSLARADWGWSPDYSLERSFQEYLIPGIWKRYSKETETMQESSAAL